MQHRFALLAIVAAMAAFAVAAMAGQEDGSLRLGINYPLTGPYSVEGLDQIRAAQMAVDEINRSGGILGRRIELEARDSASDVLLTRLNVHELAEMGCPMIFGGSSSAVALAASEICRDLGVLYFGTLTYSNALTMQGDHSLFFRECNNSWMSAGLMADWLNERYRGKKYFYVTADYTWGWTTEESMRTFTGTTDRAANPGVLTELGSTDFFDALAAAKAAKPDVLVLVLFGKDMAYALRQAAALGLKENSLIVVPNLTLGMAERAGAKYFEGVVGTLPWSWKIPSLYGYERGRRFVQDFVQRYRRYPSTSGASAYTIVHEYKAAVERAGSFEPEAVARALQGHEYTLLKDSQRWRALDHQSVQRVFMVRGNPPEKVLADPLRLDFFEVISSAPGDELVLSPEEWKRLRQQYGLPPYLEPRLDTEAAQ